MGLRELGAKGKLNIIMGKITLSKNKLCKTTTDKFALGKITLG